LPRRTGGLRVLAVPGAPIPRPALASCAPRWRGWIMPVALLQSNDVTVTEVLDFVAMALVTKSLSRNLHKEEGRKGGSFPSCRQSARAPAASGRWNERAGARSRTPIDRGALAISSAHSAALRAARAASIWREGRESSSFPPVLPVMVFQASRASCHAAGSSGQQSSQSRTRT
jgi:hypothetical protein